MSMAEFLQIPHKKYIFCSVDDNIAEPENVL